MNAAEDSTCVSIAVPLLDDHNNDVDGNNKTSDVELTQPLSASEVIPALSSSLILRSVQLLMASIITLCVYLDLIQCLANDDWMTCSHDGYGSYSACTAQCASLDNTYPTKSGTSGNYEYQEYVTPNAYWNATSLIRGTPEDTHCVAGLRKKCQCGSIKAAVVVPLLYAAQVLLLYVYRRMGPISGDPDAKPVDVLYQRALIAFTYKLNDSESLELILHPVSCLATMLQVIAVAVVISTWNFNDSSAWSCNYDGEIIQSSTLNNLYATPILILLIFELYSGNAVVALEHLRKGRFSAAVLAVFRVDAVLLNLFLTMLQLFALLLSPLMYISANRRRSATAHPSASLAVKARNVAVSKSSANSDLSSEPDPNDERSWDAEHMCSTIVRLATGRFSVMYSLCKLLGAITFSLATSKGYEYCHNQHNLLHESTCPAHCTITCLTMTFDDCNNPALQDDYVLFCPDQLFPCQFTTQECLCGNWMLIDLTVLLLHAVHFLCQCVYLLRYDTFDPQQNQIECVQSYNFFGENLAVILTHPAILLLSVLEAAILVLSWIGLGQGVSCDNSSAVSDSTGLAFALFMTFLEVYKANTSVMLRNLRAGRYAWAAYSLLRIDLFVFFGCTVFVQCFLFPFSVLGALAAWISSQLSDNVADLRDEQLKPPASATEYVAIRSEQE
jgi:hypothetical protein